jgi:hypothetical protein
MSRVYTYELLLTNEHTTREDWFRFINVVSRRVKGFRPLTLDVCFDGTVVRYFVHSRKDLSHISNGLEGFLPMPIDPEDLPKASPPTSQGAALFIYPPKFGNILDLREKYLVKKGFNLLYARFAIQRFGGFLTWRRAYFFESNGLIKRSTSQSFSLQPGLLDIDFFSVSSYVKKRVSNYLDIEKTSSFFNSRSENALLKIDTFPYTVQDRYMHLSDFEFDKHSFIVGSSGSGKSRFIQLFIDRLYATNMNMNYRVIVIDPHDSLREDLSQMPDTRIINFSKEGASLFPEAEADITASTELTSTLLLSLMGNSNARLERVLRFSTFVLFVAQAMSLSNLKIFVTDLDVRRQILDHVKGYIPDNIERFFGSEFNEIRTQYYTEAIQPIVALVDEMELQPTLSAGNDMSIAHMVRENFLTVFSLNKVRMGEKVVKTVAGLLIQQIFLLAQSRSFGSKVILFVDEVSVVQNPTLAAILAEARKFGMSVVLTQQYFGQVEPHLQQAILSNAINYYVFKVSEEDARILEGNLSMEIPHEIVERELRNGISESDIRVKMMTELHPRNCIIRVAAGGRILPAIKARTMDIGSHDSFASPPEELDSFDRQDLPGKFSYSSSSAPLPKIDESPHVPEDASTPANATTGVVDPVATAGASSVTAQRTRKEMQSPRNVRPSRGVETSPGPSMAEILATQNSSRIPLKDLPKPPEEDLKELKPPLAPYKPEGSS